MSEHESVVLRAYDNINVGVGKLHGSNGGLSGRIVRDDLRSLSGVGNVKDFHRNEAKEPNIAATLGDDIVLLVAGRATAMSEASTKGLDWCSGAAGRHQPIAHSHLSPFVQDAMLSADTSRLEMTVIPLGSWSLR